MSPHSNCTNHDEQTHPPTTASLHLLTHADPPPAWGIERVKQLLSRLRSVPAGDDSSTPAAPVFASVSSLGSFTDGEQYSFKQIADAFLAGGGGAPNPVGSSSSGSTVRASFAPFSLVVPSHHDHVHAKAGGLQLSGARPARNMEAFSSGTVANGWGSLLVRQSNLLGREHIIPHAKIFCRWANGLSLANEEEVPDGLTWVCRLHLPLLSLRSLSPNSTLTSRTLFKGMSRTVARSCGLWWAATTSQSRPGEYMHAAVCVLLMVVDMLAHRLTATTQYLPVGSSTY